MIGEVDEVGNMRLAIWLTIAQINFDSKERVTLTY